MAKKKTTKKKTTKKKDPIEVSMDENFMKQYVQFIQADTGNGFIFKMVRDLQEDAKKNNVIFTNPSEFYFYLKKHRDKLKAS